MNNRIINLMLAAPEQRDVNWLKASLQAAIELEFATVPVYLCGMGSIETQSGPAFDRIKSVGIDEMFHMALACNMLTTIGGTPRINNEDALPKFPGLLPGGVRPGLRVALTGLTKNVVEKMYMEIEFLEKGPIALFLAEVFPTIGDFYDAVLDAFRKLSAAEITGGRQIVRGSRLFAINTLIVAVGLCLFSTGSLAHRQIDAVNSKPEFSTKSAGVHQHRQNFCLRQGHHIYASATLKSKVVGFVSVNEVWHHYNSVGNWSLGYVVKKGLTDRGYIPKGVLKAPTSKDKVSCP